MHVTLQRHAHVGVLPKYAIPCLLQDLASQDMHVLTCFKMLQVYFDLGRDVTPGQDQWTPEKWWAANSVLVPSSYAYGTDTNMVPGIIVNNDLALVWLQPLDGTEVGDVGGWFSYAVNGWGFSAPSLAMGLGVPTAPASALLTNLAYPGAFDDGNRMQISNSATYFMQLNGLKRNPRGVKSIVR
jgi:hypothetical protein